LVGCNWTSPCNQIPHLSGLAREIENFLPDNGTLDEEKEIESPYLTESFKVGLSLCNDNLSTILLSLMEASTGVASRFIPLNRLPIPRD